MTKKELVVTPKANISTNPLSQALKVQASTWLYCSGQLGIDPKTGELQEGAEAQTVQVLENLKAVLEEGGSSLDKVVKTTVFLTNLADGPVVNEVYARYYTDEQPARAAFAVRELPLGAMIEIETIAAK